VRRGEHRARGIERSGGEVQEIRGGEPEVDDVEVFALVERYRLTLSEVPVEVVNSSRSTVNVARDATRLVRDLVRIRRWGRLGYYEVGDGELPTRIEDV
jgi:hypothetical protein